MPPTFLSSFLNTYCWNLSILCSIARVRDKNSTDAGVSDKGIAALRSKAARCLSRLDTQTRFFPPIILYIIRAMSSTLPLPKPSATPPSITTDNFFARPMSDFDAGINTSNAWVAEQDATHSLSDEEDEGSVDNESGRSARALYDFEGKPEFRELTIKAGEVISVLREGLADGWSLAKADGKVGLIPRAYYTVCYLTL